MIIPALNNDATAISELVNSAYRGDASRKGWTTEADLLDGTRTDVNAIADIIDRKGTTLLKYIDQGKIIGCVELAEHGKHLYLGMLTVQPGLQGGGIGKQLLKAAEDEASKRGCTTIFMTVISVRRELIDWYIRHGYQDTGKRKPFEVPDPRWGVPKSKLEFVVLEKSIPQIA